MPSNLIVRITELNLTEFDFGSSAAYKISMENTIIWTVLFHYNSAFMNLKYRIGMTRYTGHQPVARPLPAPKTAQTQNKHKQTSMPRLGFEPTTPAFEGAKSAHALDCADTVIVCILM
jgi:hypothetical protein